MKAFPKPHREISEAYTQFVKNKACCLPASIFPHQCIFDLMRNSTGIHSHHVPAKGLKGIGIKVSDRRQVPVCFSAHRYCESHPNAVREYLEQVIKSLNQEYDSLHPVTAIQSSKRKAGPSAKINISHCICGKTHNLPVHKITFVTSHGDITAFKFRCPVKNELAEARV